MNYFSSSHNEKLIDSWFKTYLPLIKENENFKSYKRLRQEIKKGVPVPLRGQVWQRLVSNKLRINNFMFTTFKSFSELSSNPLIEEDIPRTFPHLNELFEEIQSLSTSLREVLRAY
ncbi:MAG: hypothetical protein ACMG6E_08930 [Candidatus Roizmanbacteria bacterium]